MGKWAVAHTSFSDSGPLTSLAFTEDFHNFERIGATMPPENKDSALFPVRFKRQVGNVTQAGLFNEWGKGKYLDLFFPGYETLGDHQVLLYSQEGGGRDANKISLSPQPIRTYDGWLIMYMEYAQQHQKQIIGLGCSS